MLSFARTGIASLVREYPDDEVLAEYYLAYECNYYPEVASKTAKSILKTRPTSLRLYNACAMIEATRGRTDKATNIWAGALRMKDSFPSQDQEDAVMLWQSWVWSDMSRGETQTALSKLVSFDGTLAPSIDTSSLSSTAMLRVKKVCPSFLLSDSFSAG